MNTNNLRFVIIASSSSAAAIALVATLFAVNSSSPLPLSLLQQSYAWIEPDIDPVKKAPIAVSNDDNVYVVWSTDKNTPNKNGEVMFKVSRDAGKTFDNKINLSNTPTVDSIDAEINAAGNNVYVTWWEQVNATNSQPVMRISNDNGKTFGQLIILSK